MPTYHIIFRTCDVVHSLHNAPRPFGLEKRTLIKVCFASLIKTLEGFSYKIHIVGDRLSDEMLEFFNRYPVEMTLGNYGNDESLRECLRIAYGISDDEWVYFCEDDYLHSPQAFVWIEDLIANYHSYIDDSHLRNELWLQRGKLGKLPLVIHPPDYPDRYLTRYLRRSLIFLSRYCHWRQVTSTTFTFLAQAKTFKHFRKVLDYSCNNADDGYLSKKMFAGRTFRGKALCLSPIPGVATHMHEEVMSPIVDWHKIYQDAQKSIEGQK
jgi:hypothetical protein